MLNASPEDLRALAQVSDTALITLAGRAMESRRGGVLHDPMAEALLEGLRPLLEQSERPVHRRIARDGLPALSGLHLSLRARYFDDQAVRFLTDHPDGLVVSLGCGFDSRFYRLELRPDRPARLNLLDVDLPPVISLKRRLFPSREGYRMLEGDVTQPEWLDALPQAPVMVLAEGLLMYLEPRDVRATVERLVARAPGCELVAEVFQQRWLEGWRGRIVARKLSKEFDMEAGFRFGLTSARDLCDWAFGIKVLDEWSFLDEAEPRLWTVRWMGWFDSLKYTQWVARWRLGSSSSAGAS